MSDADRVQAIREDFGFGLWDAGRAVGLSNARFGGDDRMAAWFVHASQFAISARDRDGWNEDWARRRRAEEITESGTDRAQKLDGSSDIVGRFEIDH